MTIQSDFAVLLEADLHDCLSDPAMESMNFLNEIAGRFPDALSLAAGRPSESFFDLEDVQRYLRRYQRYLAEERGLSPEQVRRTVLQYGRTKGVIHELVARNLQVDEGIEADPDALVVTVGCQEAMFLVLRALRRDAGDLVLAVTPTYVGLTGAAHLADLPVRTVRGGYDGIDLEDLAAVVRQARAEGRRPRACYIVPDFANPSGISLDVDTRHALLDLAAREDLLLLEDNPYGIFTAGGERLPTLKSLDRRRQVVYLGSFAKTGLPGARVGYVLADQRVRRASGEEVLLADELSKIKSMLTVNTSPIAQAVIAGKLLEHDCSLVSANIREAAFYRANLQRLTRALEQHLPDADGLGVSWNTPAGGFFLVLNLPFEVDDALLELSARDYKVLWTPMRHFDAGQEAAHALRLCYSYLTPEDLDEGVLRLTRLIRDLAPRAGELGTEAQGSQTSQLDPAVPQTKAEHV